MFSQVHILYCQIFEIGMSGIISFINYTEAEKPTFFNEYKDFIFKSHLTKVSIQFLREKTVI